MKQKLGITLIAAYYALSGIVLLLIAAGTTFATSALGLPAELGAIGAVILGVVALLVFAVAYGIYTLESWAWYIAIILSALSVVSALFEMNLFGVIIPAIIVWYLWENQKDFKVSIDL